jgi:hypothetical protein
MSAGSRTPHGQAGSRDYDQAEPFAGDPRIAPGLARPVGWRVREPDGSAAYDKFDTGDQDWTPVGDPGGGEVTKLNAGPGITLDPPEGEGEVEISNAGVLKVTAGTAISVTPLSGVGDVTVANEGVISVRDALASSASGQIDFLSESPSLSIVLDGDDMTFRQNVGADWDAAVMRVYAIDFANGNDANEGFATPASSSAGDYATACAAAGAVAKKTFAGLAAIFPRVGNGRLVEIVIANGGVNTAQTYTGGLDLILNGSVGWATGNPVVRATGTNTNAGAVAFAGTNAEVDYAGAVTVTGLNAAGYNPTGAATTTSVPCTLNGGGAPALPAEPAAPLGWRIRFDINTTTAALRGICRQISSVSATTTVGVQTALPAVPAIGDVFYIEQPGVVCGAFTMGSFGLGTPQTGAQISGIRSTGTVIVSDSHFRLNFFGANALAIQGLAILACAQTLIHPVLGTRTIGGGIRSEGAVSCNISTGQLGTLAGCVAVGNTTFFAATQLVWGAGGYTGASITFQSCQLPLGVDVATTPQIGISAATAVPRIVGRLNCTAIRATIANVEITGAGANPAIKLTGKCEIIISQGAPSGATGNTDVGLDLTAARGSMVILASTPTVTGSLGDVRLAGGQIVTWAQAIATGIVDSAGNRILGTAGVPSQSPTPFSGTVVGGVGAVLTYFADTGPAAANNAVQLRRATSFRLATRLRVGVSANTSGNAIVVTLYKNGVATAMTVTILAGSVAGTKFVDSAHPILFLDGDDWDVRGDNAGADLLTACSVAGVVEWAM